MGTWRSYKEFKSPLNTVNLDNSRDCTEIAKGEAGDEPTISVFCTGKVSAKTLDRLSRRMA